MNDPNNEILNILKDLQQKHTKPIILNEEDVKILKDIIEDRKAFSRVFNWGKWTLMSLSAIIVSWAAISGKFFEWIGGKG